MSYFGGYAGGFSGGFSGAAPSGSVTPATVTLTYDIGSFTVWPYQITHFADRVTLAWPTTNISNVKVELVGTDGEKVLVTNNTQGTFPLKRGRAVKYAQSQALDNGAGVVDDTGEDAYPPGPTPPRGSDGLSSSFAADPERSFAYGLLPTGTAEYLLYTIDIIDKTIPVQIDYPTFLFPGEAPTVVVENSRVQCLLWPKVGDRRGPGVRIGQWVSYDPLLGYINPPLIGGLGGKMTVMDWLVLRRLVFDRDPYNGGTPDLSTELTQLYDTFEGQAPSQAAKNSIVWFLPTGSDNKVRAALVNTVSETPPLACWPTRDRDAEWNATGDHVLRVWSWHELGRHYISPGTVPLDLYDNSPRTLWTASDSAPAGWAISTHSHVLDNYEHADFDLSNTVRDFAKVSPWHGLFAVDWIALEESSGESPSYDVANQLTHVRTHIEGGTVRFAWDDNKFQRAFASADTGIAAQSQCIRIRKRSKDMLLILWVEASGSIVRYTSSDHGTTWTMSTTIATGAKPTAFVTQDGTEYLYWTDGTAIKGQIRDASGNIIESTFTAVSGMDSGSGSAAHWSVLSGGGLRVVLWVTISGSLVRYESVDSGKTFT